MGDYWPPNRNRLESKEKESWHMHRYYRPDCNESHKKQTTSELQELY